MIPLMVFLFAADANEEAAKKVLAALTRAAQANQAAAVPRAGDDLEALLTSAAARAAQDLPAERRARAFLLAIAIGLDTSALMRSNPVTWRAWRRIEGDDQRKERLRALGRPTLHGRHDLAQHFAVSCGLTVQIGPRAAEAAGVLKEMLDAQPCGSGFSFADLAADYSGVAFAEWLLDKPERLARVKSLQPFCLPPKGLAEGLSLEAFEKKYGGAKDERFQAASRKLRERIAGLKPFSEK
jgi:hypothetical protein